MAAFRAKGPEPKKIKVLEVVPLTVEDLVRLDGPRARLNTEPQRLRQSHHMIARYAALGLHQKDIALRTGYSRERVGILLASPAMNALVLDYAEKLTDKFAEMADAYLDLATSNMMAAERQIADKLDEADEEGVTLPIRELIAISRDMADRLGPAKKTSINHNHTIDFASKLDAAIARTKQAKVIDITPLAVESPTSTGPRTASPTDSRSSTQQPPSIRRIA